MNNLQEGSLDKYDPHGYGRDINREQKDNKNLAKRSFLIKCIRDIYIVNSLKMPRMSIPNEYHRCILWAKIDRLMRPANLCGYHNLVRKVKRRLFWEHGNRQRKCKKPQKYNSNLSECKHFKAARHILGTRKIARNYLNEARFNTQNDIREQLKRKFSDLEDDTKHFNIYGNLSQAFQQANSDVTTTETSRLRKKAKKLKEIVVEQQYHEGIIANKKILDASIRSVLYMKALMGIMRVTA